MREQAPRIGVGPHPTGVTQELRGFCGKVESKDANGRTVVTHYYKGRVWTGPAHLVGCKRTR